MEIRAIIPAAGKGTRLIGKGEGLPKVMFRCAGKPLLETVLQSIDFIDRDQIYIVVGYKKEQVVSYFGNSYHYVEQKEQLGTGHAVMTCADAFRDFDGSVIVTFGDMPLFRGKDMLAMCRQHADRHAQCTMMTAVNPDLTMWARVKRDANGNFCAIVEGKDCTPEEAKIEELFSGVLVFDSKALFETLPKIGNRNVQKEYYLTEVPELMVKAGMKVETFRIADGNDLRGVNTPEDLAICESLLKERIEKGEIAAPRA